MAVVVMICFARSGGTVVNQCLASLPGVVMLSEVNPLGGGWGKEGRDSPQTVKAQAKQWYDIDLEANDFIESILELEAICAKDGRYLVIRDWPFVNFVAHESNRNSPPNRLLTIEALAEKTEIIPFVLVRDAIDVWASRGNSPDEFFPSYLQFAQAVEGMKFFKFEDFGRRPGEVIRQICEYSGLPFSDAWSNYASYLKVSGDVQVKGGSRGARQSWIKPLRRRRKSSSEIRAVNASPEMKAANEIFGYPTSYEAAERESWLTSILQLWPYHP